MNNSFIAPASIEEMLVELGDNENIIVVGDSEEERKNIYVPIGALDDSLDTSVANLIVIRENHKEKKISAEDAFALIQSSYLRTVV